MALPGLSDLDMLTLAGAAYSAAPTFVCGGDVRCVITDHLNIKVVMFPGTRENSLLDWFRDFDAVPADGGALGICHEGFLSGARAALPFLLKALPPGQAWVAGGHSLGGALAVSVTALMLGYGHAPLQCNTWGAPAVGVGPTLGALMAGVPGVRYHNGDDPVPYVPLPPFRQDRPLKHIGRAALDPIDDHMVDSYAAAMALVPALSA